MKCPEVREMLPAVGEGEAVTLSMRRHLSRCADCRAEAAGYDALASGLKEMRAVHAEMPVGLERSLVAIPEAPRRADQLVSHVVRNRRAYAGGLAVAAAGAAGAALWRTRRRLAPA